MTSKQYNFYLPSYVQAKFMPGIDQDIPNLGIVEHCFYERMFERNPPPDDDFLKNYKTIFIDFIPFCLLDGCTPIIEEQEYQIEFAFSLSQLDPLYALSKELNKFKSLGIKVSYILGMYNFDGFFSAYKEAVTRKVKYGNYDLFKTNSIYFVSMDEADRGPDCGGAIFGKLFEEFEEVNLITNGENMDFNSAFACCNVDGDFKIKTKNFQVINNYMIKVV